MRPKTIERVCYAVAGLSLGGPIALPFFGITGFRGDLANMTPTLGIAVCVLAFVSGVFVTQERRKIEVLSDNQRRTELEKALSKKMMFLLIALVASMSAGYLIGARI